DGPDVDMADAEASTSASLVRTLADAQADLAAVRGPKFSPCVKTYVAKTIQAQLQRDTPGATLQSLALDRLSVPTYADATEAFRVTAVVRVQGQTLTVYVDLVFILKQRVEASASFSNLNQTFDPALERALLAKFGAKLEAIH